MFFFSVHKKATSGVYDYDVYLSQCDDAFTHRIRGTGIIYLHVGASSHGSAQVRARSRFLFPNMDHV